MNRKTLLTSLKQQVLQVQRELNQLDQKISEDPNKSSQSLQSKHSRLFSPFNCSITAAQNDKGVKKFNSKDSSGLNLTQLNSKKSNDPKKPLACTHRRSEWLKTKENFSNTVCLQFKDQRKSPNPITGEGYELRGKLSKNMPVDYFTKATRCVSKDRAFLK